MNNSEKHFDVVVIGGGPAGLSAAISADSEGAEVLLIEREGRLGGILKQCIHDGFGLVRFNKKMAGSEYAQHFIDEIVKTSVEIRLLSFATSIKKEGNSFKLTVVSHEGISFITASAIILSTGCRERTAKQIAIHGTRPSGVFTAGSAQYYTNILGQLPTKTCVVLGSGDIGLIMARRLTLEGTKVLGVYEAKSTPSGLTRNISQCLRDFDIPLHLSKTVSRVFGDERLSSVEIVSVDKNMNPIKGTEEIIECDALILSVGLIPENELAEALSVPIEPSTKGPVSDQSCMSLVNGVFVCGNALHVNDLVDYVSESGETAGKAAASYAKGNTSKERSLATIKFCKEILYVVPQKLSIGELTDKTVLFFRSREERSDSTLSVTVDGIKVFSKKYKTLRPPEMERIEVDFTKAAVKPDSEILLTLKGAP